MIGAAPFNPRGTALEHHIQSYLRATASRVRDTERIGPFLATFDRTSDHPFLSYAIPDDGAEPTADDVAALIGAYRARGRRPRLEFLPAVAPAAEAVLLAGGFAVEARPPLMTCGPADAVEIADPPGIELVTPESDAEHVARVRVTAAAFGEPAGDPDADDGGADAATVARTRDTVAAGGIVILARDAQTGASAGGGVCTPPGDGATELAGIGVRQEYRRRGVAAAITSRLAREAFAAGVRTAFLTPGDDGALRVYERAGFRSRGTMLHLVIR